MDHTDAMPIAELLDERRYLRDVADSMLSRRSEAESVVDETYRRWFGLSEAARRRIKAPRSWLARTVDGICRSRLAQPFLDDDVTHEGETAEVRRAAARPAAVPEAEVSRVQPMALDSLSPARRVRFLLEDVFGMAPGTFTNVWGHPVPERTEAQQLLHFLRLRRSTPTTPQQHDAAVRAVRQACLNDDVDLLASLLDPDVAAFFDGGGKVRALPRPVHGRWHVAHSLLKLLTCHPGTTLTTHSVNGRTGLVAHYGHQVAAVVSLDIADDQVAQVWAVLNPDKLLTWNQTPAQTRPPA
ncbi:RNA polymerase sigma factor [Streptomyces sp. AS58]|nr:RNA polymerase sigma factor [Streptomyces sp. AS58]